MYETITLGAADAVATLTLNRPDRLNAVNVRMLEELRDALAAIAAPDSGVRCLLITGAGRGFCAGQDLAERAVSPGGDRPDLAQSLEQRYNPLLRTIRGLEIPVVCAVNGVAAGSGANIALACDIVLAAQSASFIQAFSKIGLIPDCGGTWLLPRAAGMARATALAMLADKLPAERAAAWGMIWKCVPDDDLMGEARGLATHLARQPTKALAAIKRTLAAAWTNSFDEQLDLERDLQRACGRSDDYAEGVSAFLAKRQPNFQGR